MSISRLRFIKRCAEFLPRTEIKNIPANTRGFYTLLNYVGNETYDVVYVGMSGGKKAGIHSRISGHARSKRKNPKGKILWTHFSVFEVWDNIYETEIREIEGILRHIYRKDTYANILNKQVRFKSLIKIRENKLRKWKEFKK